MPPGEISRVVLRRTGNERGDRIQGRAAQSAALSTTRDAVREIERINGLACIHACRAYVFDGVCVTAGGMRGDKGELTRFL